MQLSKQLDAEFLIQATFSSEGPKGGELLPQQAILVSVWIDLAEAKNTFPSLKRVNTWPDIAL